MKPDYILNQLSLAIVDDHEVVQEGLMSYMQKNGVACVETFSNGRALTDRMDVRKFDVYIVDVELPDMDAAELIDEIRSRHSEAKIVVNTMHEEMLVVRRMNDKMVDGVVYKSDRMEQLLKAVTTVAGGGKYYSGRFRKMTNSLNVQNVILSSREVEVLRAIASGLSTKDIARQLFISENTVETHRQNLFSKLKAHNMANLIVRAIACGYLNPNEVS